MVYFPHLPLLLFSTLVLSAGGTTPGSPTNHQGVFGEYDLSAANTCDFDAVGSWSSCKLKFDNRASGDPMSKRGMICTIGDQEVVGFKPLTPGKTNHIQFLHNLYTYSHHFFLVLEVEHALILNLIELVIPRILLLFLRVILLVAVHLFIVIRLIRATLPIVLLA